MDGFPDVLTFTTGCKRLKRDLKREWEPSSQRPFSQFSVALEATPEPVKLQLPAWVHW
jgi:hypothetical protein